MNPRIHRALMSSSRLDRSRLRPLGFRWFGLDPRHMLNDRVRRFVSIILVLCVLSIGGVAQVHPAEHAGHHAQHQAATHGTVLCSWMCAAGTVLDSSVVTFPGELGPIALTPPPHFAEPSIELCQTSSSRAPPAFSL